MTMTTLHAALDPGHRAQPRVDVERILHPRSVAVFGASDSKDKFGGRIMHFLVRHGFAGEILPINPNRAEVVGRRGHDSPVTLVYAAATATMIAPNSTCRTASGISRTVRSVVRIVRISAPMIVPE